MTAQAHPGVLDPLSPSTLNKLHEVVQPPTKKRKFGQDTVTPVTAAGQLATTSIVIRAHAASLSDEPLILEPIIALPRSRFPLSWLDDTPSSRSDAQTGGLFVADIPALENDLRGRSEPTVLAVRLVSEAAIYVVERVKRGIYSLSRLARWVHEGDIVVAAKGWQGTGDLDLDMESDVDEAASPDALNWWQTAQISEPSSDFGLGDDFAGLRVEMAFEQTDTETMQVEPSFVDVIASRDHSRAPSVVQASHSMAHDDVFYTPMESQLNSAEAMDVDQVVEAAETDAKQSPAELLEGMRDHYLQALYISKTSLAYFAKGPLTRCRTAFQSSTTEGSPSPTELIEFYREAILAAKKMDLKFRESIPAAVRDAALALSDNDNAKGGKKRKSKKKKLGKNGLYPEEDTFIHKWWRDRSTTESPTHEGAREAENKKQISDLRLRETQLQILLILEVLSLESTPADVTNKPKGGEGEAAAADDEKDAPKKTRTKKPQDLNVLLELHLDRLCIWHAVSMEESTGVESAKTSSFNENHLSGKKVESDAVRDFCTEVIIPFYMSRLPEKCKLITRKFGVSGGISPAAKKTSGKSRAEPGAEVKRQQPAPKSRRSLQRVLTDEKTAAASQNRMPSLHRSKTAPSKRDADRDSLDPLLPLLGGNVRGGIQQAKRRENREVDLNAAARQHETKLRKVQMLVEQKKELDAAIRTLRKPNRELVAKDIAEDAVKRGSTGGSARKSKNPVRNPFGEGVQVMATPRGNRKRDAVVGLPPLPRSLAPSRSFAGEMPDQSLAESPVMIPSSSRRATSFSGPDANLFSSRRTITSTGIKRPDNSTELGSIQETPTRPSSKIFFGSDKSTTSTKPDDLLSKSTRGKGLFRVPNLPTPRSTTDLAGEPMAPSTPVSSRHETAQSFVPGSSPFMGETAPNNPHSGIMETPPRKQIPPSISGRSVPFQMPIQTVSANRTRAPSPPAVMGTPVKGAAAVPVTPEKSQTKSIYEQLGWDDDEMDF